MNRTADLAKIHLAKQQLGLDDATYRALLQRVAGVDSARDLDPGGRGQVLAELRRLGWRPRLPPLTGQAAKIRALWLELAQLGAVRHSGEQAMNAFVRRMTRVRNVRRLTPAQANVVIEALKHWRARLRS